ncbi:hypothetical protein GLOIN_2v1778072 [Rhizophagus irregularis DAOM 181602=DAOM 197198]|uniref:VWFA domain-containing protein n=1 Tax=Rhizophagus irregularis (strain DAOM 181602 / DAOM 197198 / MUCL 43194) TaxID=747089 RepID=A0A2P4PT91_RHIID|nr:hypothetical protein GLOIN_2v1778072 [Rhizophagus irregularis DAOM 181602=DAOM 197198]POG68570.1 hypothetical protein GLOIN_2v1778072 [Rhizophagus irregularis DAOM 181602=DAOM 197198]|eukprot:XP_025175436.1 hypothetical protein GLOIN_2v1778072 [Rhizophagus irregularis DAOM 181602=DAOM 197198]
MEIAKATTQSTQNKLCYQGEQRICKEFTPGWIRSDEISLYRSLNGLSNVASGGTRLYDSIVNVIKTFHSNGDRSRPWILVVVTDGDDNNSSLSFKKF